MSKPSDLNAAYHPLTFGNFAPPMDERHFREIERVSRGYRVPESAATLYLAVAGDTADDVSRALVAICSEAPDFFDQLPIRYPLDLMAAARTVERGCQWAALTVYPRELVKNESARGLFEPDASPQYADVLHMVRSVPPSVEPSDVVRLLRDGQWSGQFPVANAVTALHADLGWEYLLAMPLD